MRERLPFYRFIPLMSVTARTGPCQKQEPEPLSGSPIFGFPRSLAVSRMGSAAVRTRTGAHMECQLSQAMTIPDVSQCQPLGPKQRLHHCARLSAIPRSGSHRIFILADFQNIHATHLSSTASGQGFLCFGKNPQISISSWLLLESASFPYLCTTLAPTCSVG